jgi:hypothetical protein
VAVIFGGSVIGLSANGASYPKSSYPKVPVDRSSQSVGLHIRIAVTGLANSIPIANNRSGHSVGHHIPRMLLLVLVLVLLLLTAAVVLRHSRAWITGKCR